MLQGCSTRTRGRAWKLPPHPPAFKADLSKVATFTSSSRSFVRLFARKRITVNWSDVARVREAGVSIDRPIKVETDSRLEDESRGIARTADRVLKRDRRNERAVKNYVKETALRR